MGNDKLTEAGYSHASARVELQVDWQPAYRVYTWSTMNVNAPRPKHRQSVSDEDAVGASNRAARRPRDEPAVRAWWTVALLMALAFLCHFNRISMSVAGTERIMAEYRIDEVRMGTVYSAYLFAYTLCMIPGGWLIDRRGAKFALTVMGVGSGLLVIGTGAIGLWVVPALVLPALWMVRTLTGLFSVPMHPGAARSVALWVPAESRALTNSLVTAAALMGIASTYYVFGSMIDRFDWPLAFILSGLATCGLTAVWAWHSPGPSVDSGDVRAAEPHAQNTTPADATGGAPNRWYDLLRNRSLMLLTLSYAAVSYFQYLFFFWLQYYFETVLDLGRDASRFYTTIPMLAMAAGMFLGGWIADAVCRRTEPFRGRARVAMLGMLGGTLFLGVAMWAEDPNWIVAWFSCAMASVGVSEGPFWVTAVELGGSRGGMSAAIFNTGGNAGGILAPIVTPWLSGYLGWQGSVPVAGLFCLVGAALWLWIRPAPRTD